MSPPPVRIVTAVARGLAFSLGLGGLPWLGTYVMGRDLARRAAGWLAVNRGVNDLASAGRGAGLNRAAWPDRSNHPAT